MTPLKRNYQATAARPLWAWWWTRSGPEHLGLHLDYAESVGAKGGTRTPTGRTPQDPETYEVLKELAAKRRLSMNIAATLAVEAMLETEDA